MLISRNNYNLSHYNNLAIMKIKWKNNVHFITRHVIYLPYIYLKQPASSYENKSNLRCGGANYTISASRVRKLFKNLKKLNVSKILEIAKNFQQVKSEIGRTSYDLPRPKVAPPLNLSNTLSILLTLQLAYYLKMQLDIYIAPLRAKQNRDISMLYYY
jgi:hypothetical protein